MTTSGAPAAARAPGSRRVPAQVWDAEAEARRRLGGAAAEAREIVQRAHAEAAALREAAAAAGREEARADATAMIARAAVARDRLLAEAEPQVVRLALAVAGRILTRAADTAPEAVVELASRALDAVRRRADVTLRAHPEDVVALRAAEPALLQRLSRARCIAFVGDAAVERGGVVVATEAGTVDARLSTQLDALRRVLEEGS
ncbi:MAG TPA: FliH/SctL family protein [Anaeromyxobacteraceae bacterium]